MKINPVNRINVLISTHANKHKTYLYNEMWDFAKEHKLGGSFGNDYITINGMPENLLDKLKKLGIKKNNEVITPYVLLQLKRIKNL